MANLLIPADVPKDKQEQFKQNYNAITKNKDRLFLFACDQKIEHWHDDFDPDDPNIADDAIDPEHFFRIASQGNIGAMATQLELIARYGLQYPQLNYVAKLNSKTNLTPDTKDPESAPLWDVDQVVVMQQESKLQFRAIGVTVYPGSEFEADMMNFAAQSIFDAHQHGLLAIVWMYPRGKAIKDPSNVDLIAGAAGAANALGADFVKIKPPLDKSGKQSAELLTEVVAAAGNTKVICSGGKQVKAEQFLQTVYDQIHMGNVAGTAIGRNVFQHELAYAVSMTEAISAIVYDDASTKEAAKLLHTS